MVDRYADALRGLRRDLDRRRDPRRVGTSTSAPQAFRDGLARIGVPDDRVALRAVRRHPRGDRLPLPAGAGLAGPAPGPLTAGQSGSGPGVPSSRPRPTVAPSGDRLGPLTGAVDAQRHHLGAASQRRAPGTAATAAEPTTGRAGDRSTWTMSGRTRSTARSASALVGDVGEHDRPAPAAHLGDGPLEQPQVGQPVVVHLGGDRQLPPAAAERDGQPRRAGAEVGLAARASGARSRARRPRSARSKTRARKAQSSRSTRPREAASPSRASVSASSVPGRPRPVAFQPTTASSASRRTGWKSGPSWAGVGDELFDEGPGSPGAVELVDEARGDVTLRASARRTADLSLPTPGRARRRVTSVAPRASRRGGLMTIVVGYVPRAEGRAALRRAAEEARLRRDPAGRHQLQPRRRRTSTTRTPSSTSASSPRCGPSWTPRASSTRSASWCAAWTRPRTSSPWPSETGADFIVIGLRRRTPVGQAHPRLERPAHPARGALPGARRQGGGVDRRTRQLGRMQSWAFRSPASPRPTRCSTVTRSASLVGHAARPAVPDGARVRRAGWKIAERLGVDHSTRPTIAALDPEAFAALCRDPAGRAPLPRQHGRRGCRRWPRLVVDEYDGDAAAPVDRARGNGAELLRPAHGAAGLRRRQGREIFVALLGKQRGRAAGRLGGGGRRLRRGRVVPLGGRRGRRGEPAEGPRLQAAAEAALQRLAELAAV